MGQHARDTDLYWTVVVILMATITLAVWNVMLKIRQWLGGEQ